MQENYDSGQTQKITRLIILSDKESWPQANQIVHQAFGFHLAKGKSSTYSKGLHFELTSMERRKAAFYGIT